MEDVVLFDEWRWEDWPITDMNSYLDKWQCTLNCRYANKHAYWTHIYICANSSPESWYPTEAPYLRDAFFRRINCIHLINSREQNIII